MQWLEQYIDLKSVNISDILFVGYEIVALILTYILLASILSLLIKKADKIELLKSYHTKVVSFASMLKSLLKVLVVVILIAIVGFNGYLIYSGEQIESYSMDLIQGISVEFYKTLAINIVKIIALIIAAKVLIKYTLILLESLELKSKNYRQIEQNNSSIEAFFKRTRSIIKVSIWLLILYTSFKLFDINELASTWTLIVLKIFLIISVALLITNLVSTIVKSLDELSRKYAETKGLLGFYSDLSHLVPIFRKSLEYIIYAISATLVLKQLSFLSWLAQYGAGVIQAIGLIFIARVVVEVINLIIDKTYLQDKIEADELNRNRTIYPILKSVLAVGIYFVVLIFVLRGFGFDPLPLLAGAGILGMVIGLGAQSLINDLVSGFFLILEGTYGVGDYVQINEASGFVESITLRTTRLRSEDGKLFILRNGEINDVTNYSNNFTHALVDVGVESNSDMQKVYQTLQDIATEYAKTNDAVIEKTKTLGVEDFSTMEVVIRTLTKVKPGTHLQVQRELKRVILERFADEQIIIPFDKREF